MLTSRASGTSEDCRATVSLTPSRTEGAVLAAQLDAAHQPCSLLFQTQQLGARREHLGPKAAPSLPEEVRTLTALWRRGELGGIGW